MTVKDLMKIYHQQRENTLEIEPVHFRIRSANAEKIHEIQKKFGRNKSQIINDLLAIGLAQFQAQQ